MVVKGKWAQGIKPRNFAWVIKDQLAVCERLGGYGSSHRRVRRQEEIIWVREQGFTFVISVIPSTSNLHNYDEFQLPWKHWPFPVDDPSVYLRDAYRELDDLLRSGNKLLMHNEELSDRLCGLVGGYLLYRGLVDTAPRTVVAIEQLTGRQLGPIGREIVAIALQLRDAKDATA
jgi:hypothetical protein